jgi:uncharacterized protein involved in exopolysaccharide biosynthesis
MNDNDLQRGFGRIESSVEALASEVHQLRSEFSGFRALPQRVTQLEKETAELRGMVRTGVKFALGGAISGGSLVGAIQALLGS